MDCMNVVIVSHTLHKIQIKIMKLPCNIVLHKLILSSVV